MNKTLRFFEKYLGCQVKDLFFIIIGTALLAVGLAWYANPFGMVTGGITGIAIIITNISQSLFGFEVPLWLTNLVLNIPLFLISGFQRGYKFVQKSVYGVIFLSIWLWVFEETGNLLSVDQDIFLGCAACGILSGIGLGLVLRAEATTGGTDMLGAIFKKLFGHISLSFLIFILDGIIILGGVFVFGINTTLYTIISVFITTKLISAMLDGMYFAKAAFILSDKAEEISKEIAKVFDHSSTSISARGMYTGEKKDMLFVVVYPKEVGTLRNLIHELDPKAFVTICDAHEVLGEGFIEDQSSVLR